MTQRESRVFPSFVKALTVAGCVLAASAICAHGRLLAAGNSDANAVKPSPDYGLTVWAAEKGQPPGDVFAIAQDAEGYLWLGTPNGLYRFDGARFTPWNAISPATPLPNGPVHALIGAPDGSLWIGLGGGGGVVRVVRGQVTRYTPAEGAPPGVTGMIQDRQGAIWAAANRGLYRFLNDRWTLMGEPDGYNGAEAFSVYEDRSGSVWAGTAAGVYRRSKDRFELVDATSTNVQSLDHLRRAMKLAPGDERALVRLADVLVSERRLAEAERELLAWPQRSGPIAYRLAQIYQKQSVLDKAAPAMQESDTFDPVIGRDYFYQSWGSLLVNQADFDGAVSAYRRRIEVNPNSAEAHRQLGEIYILQGRHEEALTELSVATWLDPADAKAHAAAGQVYARIARYSDAIGALSRALALDGTLREARYTLGTVLTRTGRAEEGKTALDLFGRQQADAEALGRREFELDALRRQASKHALAGESAEAIAVLERVASLDPESSRSHRDLGVALLRARRAVDAIEHLQRAQRLEETADGYAQLADAYAASGNADASARMRTAYMEAKQRATLERIHELAK